jgi:pimeloyl-ACP methyl ester carboxylesterase
MTPIVLIPGLLCSAELFAPQIPALWPYGPVMVASTLKGATLAEIAQAILSEAPPRFALAGLSMGGHLSFEILRQAPERVVKLALLDTMARPEAPEMRTRRLARLDEARRGAFERIVVEIFAGFVHPSRRDDPAILDVALRMGRTVGLGGYQRQVAALIDRPDSRPGLSAISVPTLVLVGDADPQTPPERSEEMAAAIPGARLVVVAECGHASTLEQPDAVNRALVEWIVG